MRDSKHNVEVTNERVPSYMLIQGDTKHSQCVKNVRTALLYSQLQYISVLISQNCQLREGDSELMLNSKTC